MKTAQRFSIREKSVIKQPLISNTIFSNRFSSKQLIKAREKNKKTNYIFAKNSSKTDNTEKIPDTVNAPSAKASPKSNK